MHALSSEQERAVVAVFLMLNLSCRYLNRISTRNVLVCAWSPCWNGCRDDSYLWPEIGRPSMPKSWRRGKCWSGWSKPWLRVPRSVFWVSFSVDLPWYIFVDDFRFAWSWLKIGALNITVIRAAKHLFPNNLLLGWAEAEPVGKFTWFVSFCVTRCDFLVLWETRWWLNCWRNL